MSASRFQRRAGFLPIRKRVVIATEGARTEPIYFNGLFKRPDSVLQIVVLGSPRRGAKSSPQAVLARLEQAAAQDRRTGDQFWVVIDRDQWQPKALDGIAKRCRERSFELAVSNPCFEYWLYLHFAEPREFNNCIESPSTPREVPGIRKDQLRSGRISPRAFASGETRGEIGSKEGRCLAATDRKPGLSTRGAVDQTLIEALTLAQRLGSLKKCGWNMGRQQCILLRAACPSTSTSKSHSSTR